VSIMYTRAKRSKGCGRSISRKCKDYRIKYDLVLSVRAIKFEFILRGDVTLVLELQYFQLFESYIS